MCDHLNSTLFIESGFTLDLLDDGMLNVSFDNHENVIDEYCNLQINYCPICGEPIDPNVILNDYAIVDFDKNEIIHTIAGVYEIDAMKALEMIIEESYAASADLIRFTHIAEAENKVTITRLK